MDVIDSFRGDYAFLSNFYSCSIRAAKRIWPSAEHLYQAMKTEDVDYQEQIRRCLNPSSAKKLGKTIPLRAGFHEMKVELMKGIVKLKFEQNPLLALRLMETAPKKLIEGNTWGDTFWGVCNGGGKNHLGLILMGIRDKMMIN